jgi:hypothetical protein
MALSLQPQPLSKALARSGARHLRWLELSGPRNFSVSAPRGRQRLVILGSGWGGYEVLRQVDKKRWGSSTRFFKAMTVFLPEVCVIQM